MKQKQQVIGHQLISRSVVSLYYIWLNLNPTGDREQTAITIRINRAE